jgi:peptidoglycan/xylan/chitin deacetylase (PgdA/CDA1 family)
MSTQKPVPVLMYHQITPRPHPAMLKYSVTPAKFRMQMAWLAWAGYRPVTLDAVLTARTGRGSLPRQPVVITFDDGFQDSWNFAVPVLQSRGFSAIFFLVAGLIGARSTWLLSEKGVEFPLLDWTAARGLEAAGLECGAHSMTHPRLAALDSAACRRELHDSRLRLEDRLGRPVIHLAYPFGSYDPRVRAAARETGYETACSVRIGLSPANDDPLALHRVPVLGTDSLADFVARLRTAKTVRDVALSVVRRARRRLIPHRGLGT